MLIMKKEMIKILCFILGCVFMLSCGNYLSQKKMNDLESRAEKGDSAAANTLFNYIINEPCPIPLGQVKELRNKALKGDKDAEEKVEEYNNFCEKIIKWGVLAANHGNLKAAYFAAEEIFRYDPFLKKYNEEYRECMDLLMENENDPAISEWKSTVKEMIEEYQDYKTQSEALWQSDSIGIKKEMEDCN